MRSQDPINHPPGILMEDDPIHSPEHPFCPDPSCSCHRNPDLLAEVAQAVQEGLLTAEEAAALVAGHTL